jgi:hypothetical protein
VCWALKDECSGEKGTVVPVLVWLCVEFVREEGVREREVGKLERIKCVDTFSVCSVR